MKKIKNFYKNPDGTYTPITKGSKIMFLNNASMRMGMAEHEELTLGKVYTVKKVIVRDDGDAHMCTIWGKGDKEYALYHFEDLENPMHNEIIPDKEYDMENIQIITAPSVITNNGHNTAFDRHNPKHVKKFEKFYGLKAGEYKFR